MNMFHTLIPRTDGQPQNHSRGVGGIGLRQVLISLVALVLVGGSLTAGPATTASAVAPSAVSAKAQTSTKLIKTVATFPAGKSKLTSGSKKRIRKAVKRVNRLGAAKRNQTLVLTARAAGTCATARVATRGEVSCAWRVLANKRAKAIKKYVRSAGFKGRVATKTTRSKTTRAKRALAPAKSTLVFKVKTKIKPKPPVPPTPPVVSCEDGGLCKVGDTGPGGGTVLYVAASEQSWGTYIEVAPEDAKQFKIWGCRGVVIPGDNGSGIGDGKANTEDILAQQDVCAEEDPNGYRPFAAIAASEYLGTNGTTPGWYLPSEGELNQVCRWQSGQPTGVGTESDPCNGVEISDGFPAWSSTQITSTQSVSQYFSSGLPWPNQKDAAGYVWPVRAFNPTVN